MLRAETLTLKKGKRAFLKGETARAELQERELAKIPIFLKILTKIQGKRPRFQASLRIFAVLVLVFAFLGFVLVFSAFFWFVAMDIHSILGFHVILNIVDV